jgi:hypothetical protein
MQAPISTPTKMMAAATSIQFWNVTPRSVKRSASQLPHTIQRCVSLTNLCADLDAPAQKLAITVVDRVHAGTVTGRIGPIAGIRDHVEALRLEEGFGVGEEGELRGYGYSCAGKCKRAA